jgi:hypothetical protein
MKRSLLLLAGVLLLLGLGSATPTLAKEKVRDTDLAGLMVLMGADATPTAAANPAPASAPAADPASGELTMNRFVLGFGLIILGTLGAAAIMLTMRRLRRTLGDTLAEPKPRK